MVKFRRQNVPLSRQTLAGAAVLCVTVLMAGLLRRPQSFIGVAQLRSELRYWTCSNLGSKRCSKSWCFDLHRAPSDCLAGHVAPPYPG